MTAAALGFTGTRHGMTPAQRAAVAEIIRNAKILHHGDCLGADREAHDIATAHRAWVVVHPPATPQWRAFCPGHEHRTPKQYLKRNRDIVDETDELLAAPEGPAALRSGTWATVRYALSVGRRVTIVWPDGSAEAAP